MGEPLDGNDAVSLQFVQDHCLLVDDNDPAQDSIGGGGVIKKIGVKGRNLAKSLLPTISRTLLTSST